MKTIFEQAWQNPVNSPPVGKDDQHICYPSVNTCLTMTFCFDRFLVGVHLGQTMGAPRGDDSLTHPDLIRYMQAVKQHIGRRPTPRCWGMFVLGAIDAWDQHGECLHIQDGLTSWTNELTGNPVRQVYRWDDDSQTVNIHVNKNPRVPRPFAFYVANNTKDKNGKITAVQNGAPITPVVVNYF